MTAPIVPSAIPPPAPLTLAHPAVRSRAEMIPLLEEHRQHNQRIVFTNGCFDIIHPGHVDLLARCRALGDLLVVGLNSDDSVRRLGKAPDRPLNPFAARAFVLAHLASVSYVVEFDEDTPAELVACLKPNILIKGGDWPVNQIAGRETVQALGGTVLSLPLLGDFSTTALVNKIFAH